MNYQYNIALSFATENENLVEKVYHYLKAKQIKVFFAPSPEGQIFLSGKNQREAFYDIFGNKSEYVALFVSKYYVAKEVPMEEASIAFAEHADNGSVIPIYLDGTILPSDLFDPKSTNYFKSNNPAQIAKHLSEKIKMSNNFRQRTDNYEKTVNTMNIENNKAYNQTFVNTMNGNIIYE